MAKIPKEMKIPVSDELDGLVVKDTCNAIGTHSYQSTCVIQQVRHFVDGVQYAVTNRCTREGDSVLLRLVQSSCFLSGDPPSDSFPFS